ncbi:MAG TPA: cation:proton antiporter [Polyangiaceae bacterium]
MTHEPNLIMTVAGALAAALALGLLTQRLRLSPIVGYLIAGVLVGPHTPGFVADTAVAEQLAELGVILLMFGVGLHFHVKDLLAVRRIAVPGAIVQIAAATGLGVAVTQAFGWKLPAGIVFGLAISVASTVVLIRVLSDNDALHTRAGHVAVGWLVVEDIFTVLVLVMLPIVAGSSSSGDTGSVVAALANALVRIAVLVGMVWSLGRWVLPRLLAYVARTRSRELFTLSVLVLALGIAVGSSAVFGVSMALGAFLAGMVVGQSEFSFRAASEALPMRDAFAVLFFVSVGMLLDPAQLPSLAPLILATLGIVLAGKACAAFLVVRVLRHPVSTAVAVAVALAQIGEFSFILANLGRESGILPDAAGQVLVATAIVSITLNPLLYRLVGPVTRWLSREPAANGQPGIPQSSAHAAIVIGYGPVGQSLVRQFREHDITTTVVELNHETVSKLQREGVRAVYGDAAQETILENAGIAAVDTLVFSASGTPPEGVIRAARALNPDVRILARSAYVREVAAAKRAGADVVFSAEAEVALAMVEHLLVELGATPEQLDRARERTRDELGAIRV